MAHASSAAVYLSLCHIDSVQLLLPQESGHGPEVIVHNDFPIFCPSPIYIFFPSDWGRVEAGGLWSDLFLAPSLRKESSNNHKQALIALIYGAGLASQPPVY